MGFLCLHSSVNSNFNTVQAKPNIVGTRLLGLWVPVCDLCLKATLNSEQVMMHVFIHLENIY